MKATTTVISLVLSFQAVVATTHTTCYNFFLKKDGCVFSAAASNQRCPAPTKDHTNPVHQFDCPKPKSHPSKEHSLQRRYDNNIPSFAVAGGNGVCGPYNSTTDLGVCLWSGAADKSPTLESAGWLNGLRKSNCGKQIYIQRKGQPGTVKYVKVLDGCSFSATRPDPGCFEIALTSKLFNEFKPSPKEKKDGLLYGGMTWDFNNLDGLNNQASPV